MSDNKPLILIADDEEPLRLLASETLQDDRYDIVEVSDGNEALVLAQRDHPALILLDVSMPGLTGFEVCQLLKADSATSDIIVIMLTAHGQNTDREQAEASGANFYITKPFSPAQLLKLVDQIIP